MAAKMCSIEGCNRPASGRGWCKRHYEDMRIRNGGFQRTLVDHLGTYRNRTIGDRSDPCWPWCGSIKRDGYGLFSYKTSAGRRTTMNAHRAVYEMLVGPIPEGLQLDHLCRNPPCVNPAHLEPVTRGENVYRGLTGRGVFACGHPVTEENTRHTTTTRRCRTCWRRQDAVVKRRWRARNPEAMKERNQNYYQANRERLIEAERLRKKRKTG